MQKPIDQIILENQNYLGLLIRKKKLFEMFIPDGDTTMYEKMITTYLFSPDKVGRQEALKDIYYHFNPLKPQFIVVNHSLGELRKDIFFALPDKGGCLYAFSIDDQYAEDKDN